MKAFPTEHPISGSLGFYADGMDLRDYFAAKAMQKLLDDIKSVYEPPQMKKLVHLSYEIADAMMKEREL